ncbi:MAG: prepilin-type N-terminal cleavage/methylation domain-containing protein [Planctomycetota bacterium]|nr:prepilin-type N-terminal cleavage/methylation domain-containing protein [Planctomycetota bacterium]
MDARAGRPGAGIGGAQAPAGRPARGRRRGLTLVELLVAMFITSLIGMIVYAMYTGAIDSMNRMERELRALQSFRSAMDRMERDLGGICVKAGYTAWQTRQWFYDSYDKRAGWYYDDTYPMATKFKPIHRSMLRICFRNRYIGFYRSNDGRHIDRVEYYYNAPEPRLKWANGEDDDGDDPGNGLDMLVDDRGCLMIRETPDSLPGGVDINPNLTFEHYAREPSQADFGRQDGWGWPPWLRGGDLVEENYSGKVIDAGEILADAVKDVQFWYMYSTLDSDMPKFAHCWPYVGEPGEGDAVAGGPYATKVGGGDAWSGKREDKTGVVWPRPDVDIAGGFGRRRSDNAKGLSFMTLPQAIQVDLVFDLGVNVDLKLSKTIWLHASKWYDLMTREMSGTTPGGRGP